MNKKKEESLKSNIETNFVKYSRAKSGAYSRNTKSNVKNNHKLYASLKRKLNGNTTQNFSQKRNLNLLKFPNDTTAEDKGHITLSKKPKVNKNYAPDDFMNYIKNHNSVTNNINNSNLMKKDNENFKKIDTIKLLNNTNKNKPVMKLIRNTNNQKLVLCDQNLHNQKNNRKEDKNNSDKSSIKNENPIIISNDISESSGAISQVNDNKRNINNFLKNNKTYSIANNRYNQNNTESTNKYLINSNKLNATNKDINSNITKVKLTKKNEITKQTKEPLVLKDNTSINSNNKLQYKRDKIRTKLDKSQKISWNTIKNMEIILNDINNNFSKNDDVISSNNIINNGNENYLNTENNYNLNNINNNLSSNFHQDTCSVLNGAKDNSFSTSTKNIGGKENEKKVYHNLNSTNSASFFNSHETKNSFNFNSNKNYKNKETYSPCTKYEKSPLNKQYSKNSKKSEIDDILQLLNKSHFNDDNSKIQFKTKSTLYGAETNEFLDDLTSSPLKTENNLQNSNYFVVSNFNNKYCPGTTPAKTYADNREDLIKIKNDLKRSHDNLINNINKINNNFNENLNKSNDVENGENKTKIVSFNCKEKNESSNKKENKNFKKMQSFGSFKSSQISPNNPSTPPSLTQRKHIETIDEIVTERANSEHSIYSMIDKNDYSIDESIKSDIIYYYCFKNPNPGFICDNNNQIKFADIKNSKNPYLLNMDSIFDNIKNKVEKTNEIDINFVKNLFQDIKLLKANLKNNSMLKDYNYYLTKYLRTIKENCNIKQKKLDNMARENQIKLSKYLNEKKILSDSRNRSKIKDTEKSAHQVNIVKSYRMQNIRDNLYLNSKFINDKNYSINNIDYSDNCQSKLKTNISKFSNANDTEHDVDNKKNALFSNNLKCEKTEENMKFFNANEFLQIRKKLENKKPAFFNEENSLSEEDNNANSSNFNKDKSKNRRNYKSQEIRHKDLISQNKYYHKKDINRQFNFRLNGNELMPPNNYDKFCEIKAEMLCNKNIINTEV